MLHFRFEAIKNALPEEIDQFRTAASAEGFGFVERLIDDFESGANRFSQPGECLCMVCRADTFIGVGGINIDPYAANSAIGRVRRFYISPEARRLGAGQALLKHLEMCAAATFESLRLRTTNPVAALFYESQGYERVNGDDAVTHVKKLSNPL